MKVILREDVSSLGKSGDVVEVREGYGRNYLLPRDIAVLANPKNVKQLEHEKAVITQKQAKARAGAETLAQKLGSTQIKLSRKVGEQGKLFGSVTALDIAEALAAKGLPVDRRHIHLADPIRAVGSFDVEVKLHAEVAAKVKVEVIAAS